MRPLARTFQDPATWAAWGHLAHSVRTGDNAFEALHGVDVWSYRGAHREANAVFNATMAALTSRMATAVAAAHDFVGPLDRRRRRRGRRRAARGGAGAAPAADRHRLRPATGPAVGARRPARASPSPPGGPRSAETSSSPSPRRTPTCSRRCCTTGRTSSASRSSTTCRRSLDPGGVVLVVESRARPPGPRARGRAVRSQHARHAGRSRAHRRRSSPPSSLPPGSACPGSSTPRPRSSSSRASSTPALTAGAGGASQPATRHTESSAGGSGSEGV